MCIRDSMATVHNLIASTRQTPIFAMRLSRATTLSQITKQTHLSADEIRRFNPALVKRVPNGRYTAALTDFLALNATPEQWDDGSVVPVLRAFEKRFRESKSEEG